MKFDFIIVDTSDPYEGSMVHAVIEIIQSTEFSCKFINLLDDNIEKGLAAKYLLITGDRLPERNIVNKINHTHLIYIQHGYQSSLKKNSVLYIIRKLVLYRRFLDLRFLFKPLSTDAALLISGGSSNRIVQRSKVQLVFEDPRDLLEYKYNDSSDNILLIDQPLVGNGNRARHLYAKDINTLVQACNAKGSTVVVKLHPRTEFLVSADLKVWCKNDEVKAAVGWSSSLLFQLANTMPVFTFLEPEELPEHAKWIPHVRNLGNKSKVTLRFRNKNLALPLRKILCSLDEYLEI